MTRNCLDRHDRSLFFNGFALLLLVLVVGCSWLPSGEPPGQAFVVKKSPNDQREYRYVRLANELPVLLIADSKAEKAAASLDVNVGARHDPEGREGLAHFLEHMLFLGTEKYPNAGEYQAFISENGGSHNAFTSFEHTNYFFDIENGQLDEALDRFADFFVAPLFTSDYVQREMNAVESEYRARFKDEGRRVLDAMKAAVNPQHPFSKFTIGSLSTLGSGVDAEGRERNDIRDDLLAFHAQHYSASQMALVVMGNYSLDQLEQMVSSRFVGIANTGARPQDITVPLYTGSGLLAVVPEKPVRQLRIAFPTPDIYDYYRSKPLQYIGNIIGHEGEGSLLSMLKARGWAESLGAGTGLAYHGGSTFQVSISLTDQGVDHVGEITDLLFEVIGKIRKDGISREKYNEQRQLSEIAFRFYEKQAAIQTVVGLAGNLHVYPPHSVIYGDYEYSRFDEAIINRFLDYLRPEVAQVVLVSQQLPFGLTADRISPWFGTAYGLHELPVSWQQQWQEATMPDQLQLPAANPFIPDDFDLVSQEQSSTIGAAPEKIIDEAGYRAWIKTDREFRRPKADVFFSMQSRLPSSSARNAALAQLYVRVVNDQLNEFLYPAYLAGMDFSFYSHARGFSLKVSGYNDSIKPLLAMTIPELSAINIDQDRLADIKQEMSRQLELATQDTPYRRLGKLAVHALYANRWMETEILEQLPALGLQDLREFIAALQRDVVVEALVHGNVSLQSASALLDIGRNLPHCQCAFDGRTHIDVVRLPREEQWLQSVELDHSDAAASWYFQADSDDIGAVATTWLTAKILHPQFFHELRTEQQLGYIVGVDYFPMHRWPGLLMQVQSPSASADGLESAIKTFLQNVVAGKFDEQAFTKHRDALVAELREKDQTLHQRSSRYWLDIALGYRNFDRRQQLADTVAALDYQQWQASLLRLFGSQSASLLMATAPVGAGDKDSWPPSEPKLVKSYP